MNFVKDAVVFLDNVGVWDFIIPFIFVFAVSYATLEKTKVLGTEKGEPRHRFNAIVSVVIGLFVVVAVDVLNVISRLSQYMVLLILAAVCLAVIFGFFGFTDVRSTRYGKYFLPIAFIVFGIVVLYAMGWMGYLDLSSLRRYEGLLIVIIVFFLIMWFILREGKPAGGKASAKPAEEAPEKPAPKPSASGEGPKSKEAPEEESSEEQYQKMLQDNILRVLSKKPELEARFKKEYAGLSDEEKLPFLIDVAQQIGLLKK